MPPLESQEGLKQSEARRTAGQDAEGGLESQEGLKLFGETAVQVLRRHSNLESQEGLKRKHTPVPLCRVEIRPRISRRVETSAWRRCCRSSFAGLESQEGLKRYGYPEREGFSRSGDARISRRVET